MPDAASGGFPLDFCLYCHKINHIVITFCHSCSRLPLGNTLCGLWHKQDLHRCEHDLEILDNAWMCYVHQVHNQLVVGGRVVLAVNLRVAGQTSFCLQAQGELRHFLTVLGSNFRAFGAGTHNTKLTFQNVDKLRQLIYAASANHLADRRDAVIMVAAGQTATPSFSASTRILRNFRMPNSLPSWSSESAYKTPDHDRSP